MINRVAGLKQNNAKIQTKSRTSFGTGIYANLSCSKQLKPLEEHSNLLDVLVKVAKGDFKFESKDLAWLKFKTSEQNQAIFVSPNFDILRFFPKKDEEFYFMKKDLGRKTPIAQTYGKILDLLVNSIPKV